MTDSIYHNMKDAVDYWFASENLTLEPDDPDSQEAAFHGFDEGLGVYKSPVITSNFLGKKAAVIGGGNVAMDSVRTAQRLGAEEAMIIYRRSRVEMPARVEEVHHAEEEGIEFHLLTAPIRYVGDDKGRVKAMECIRMELGEPDSSGRRRPVPIEGSEFTREVDLVVVAIGQSDDAMHVLGQHHPGVDPERAFPPRASHRLPQGVDAAYQQIRAAFEQIDGQEIGPAGNPQASIVRHIQRLPDSPITRQMFFRGFL